MDAKTAFDEHVRKKLEDNFGPAMTVMILATAYRDSGVDLSVPARDDFFKLTEAICGDERVVGMWGKAGADQALRQWQALL